jgi:cytochrome c oxidase cbb3-type subunit 3
VFYACIVWSIGYWIVYPAWPSLSGYTAGLFGYSTRATFSEQMREVAEARAVWTDRFQGQTVEQVAANPDLLNYSIAGGRAAFAVNCKPCHGAGGQGAPGYPVLADDDWIWGGDLASIEQTIRYGIRNPHESSRQSEMPRFGVDGLLTADEIADAAAYVLTLSGGNVDAAAAERGKTLFAEQCAACHGEDGKGIAELGAPNLTDPIWLFGDGSRERLIAQIADPRQGVMPNWDGRLDDATIKMVTIYVHALGGGQ